MANSSAHKGCQSGLKTGDVVGAGLKTGDILGPKNSTE